MKVGEYIRTKDGIIDKVIIEYNGKCASSTCNCKHVSCEKDYYDEDKIIKSSPNIIDLIEEHDFVGIEYFSPRYEERVTRVFEVDYVMNKSICFENGYSRLNILNGDWSIQDKQLKPIIKSIVTKEQFSQMEYRIEE